jgi:hypothetical protein
MTWNNFNTGKLFKTYFLELFVSIKLLLPRITAYEDSWGKVLKFYEKYSKVENLKTDGINEATLAIEIHRALDDFIEQRERKKREESEKEISDEISRKEQELLKEQEKAKKKIEDEATELAKVVLFFYFFIYFW